MIRRAALALVLAGLLGVTGPALAVDPGLPLPVTSEGGDTRLGSILIYNFFSSSATDPDAEDTRFTLTNTSDTTAVAVRLFFVDGRAGATPPSTAAGNVADATVCLSANQTTSFLASEVRPGWRGFVVAIGVDPTPPNCLTGPGVLSGQAHVRLASGFRGVLEAIGLHSTQAAPSCILSADQSLALLVFDGLNLGGSHSRVPRVLSLVDLLSPADQRTLLVINRIGGNLGIGAATLGTLFGILSDDAENVFGFAVPSVTSSQLVVELTDAFPATAPPLSDVIPAGRTGWLKIFSQSDIGLTGAALFAAPGPAALPVNARQAPAPAPLPAPFATGALNLTPSTLSASGSLIIPLFPSGC